MEFILDSADIEKIRRCVDTLPVSGVTTNPSILAKAKDPDIWARLEKIKSLIPGRLLHVQVTADTCEDMLREAEILRKRFGSEVAVKVPVTEQGLKVIKILKREGYTVTGTAVYSLTQAYFAMAAGADWLAPYYNRIETAGQDAAGLVRTLRTVIDREKSSMKILGASFHREEQVISALSAGAHAVTVQPDMYIEMLSSPAVADALLRFSDDWTALTGGKRLDTLC